MDNKDIIFNLVADHFSLSEESLEKFMDALYNPYIDETYKKILGENSLKKEIILDNSIVENIDFSWREFKNIFRDFCLDTKITYPEYRSNIVEIKKNKVKIKKALLKYYSEESNFRKLFRWGGDYETVKEREVALQEHYLSSSMFETKFPKEDVKIVLSLDYADWFLCSTGENWGSCLNMEGGNYFWVGLPGIITDKNRAMIYLTTGKKKNIYGIETDKVIARSWVLLDEDNDLFLNRWYPNSVMSTKELTKLFNYRFVEMKDENHFISKHPVDLLFYTTKRSVFVYKDYYDIGDDFYLHNLESKGCQPGFSSYDLDDKEWEDDDPNFDSIPNLSVLIKSKSNIYNFHNKVTRCIECGNSVLKEEITAYRSRRQEYILCKSCLEKSNMHKCHICGEVVPDGFCRDIEMQGEEISVCAICQEEKISFCCICRDAIINEGKPKKNVCEKHEHKIEGCKGCRSYYDLINGFRFYCNCKQCDAKKSHFKGEN